VKCLSLWQPWATLLVTGHKRIETRGWPMRHRGPLLIHAAKKWTTELWTLCGTEPFHRTLHDLGYGLIKGDGRGMPFGAIVGRVNVASCYRSEDVRFESAGSDYCPIGSGSMWGMGFQAPETERPFGDYSADRFAFVCTNPVAFTNPIPYRGRQGLFDVTIPAPEDAPCP
jgi:hypothetical protein